ncbi:NADH-quinone oxidoreductase subunit L [Falsibacillus pallidus]|uniref:NADH-quinone oxidoreductase subunit L n=1 Tax=Falsibacillus pallidus TaxID=493781 RepID=UPI003D9643CE
MNESAWLIPIVPLLAFLLILLLQRGKDQAAAYTGILATAISFILSAMILFDGIDGEKSWDWLKFGDYTVKMGFELTTLNVLMLVLVSFISLMVQIYSLGYMKSDKRMAIFYGYLNFFTFAMLGLVLSPNLLQLYFFWELVGLGSFLLIGFYFYKQEAKQAAKKAFIMTRIGDVGLLIGIILLYWKTGSFDYDDIFASIGSGDLTSGMITLTALLIFVGAMGKSGQFPLHSWLPDAMEGPTPISALIHAATMVAAGVYLVAVMFPLFEASSAALLTVSIVGGFTAIFAAFLGLVQYDIKRILAYSTVSQLGYMMLALGSAGYTAGVFHLFTHAFFKSLLFLAVGSVIHAAHTQDIRDMGGLWGKMKFTAPLFLIGALALTGFPFFSGFFSKEAIFTAIYENGPNYLFWLALITAFFTSIYVFRMFFMVFFRNRTGHTRHASIQESPAVMIVPMAVLAVFAFGIGFIESPWSSMFSDWLRPDLATVHAPGWIMMYSSIFSLMGIFFAYYCFQNPTFPPEAWSTAMPITRQFLLNKGYIDEVYGWTVVRFTKGFGKFLRWFDSLIVEGIASGAANLFQTFGKFVTRMQNGQVQRYGFAAVAGLVLIMLVYFLTGGYFG